MKTVADILKKKKAPLTQSQRMRALIFRWWEHDVKMGLTGLTQEEFYQDKTEIIMRGIKAKFPDDRFSEDSFISEYPNELPY